MEHLSYHWSLVVVAGIFMIYGIIVMRSGKEGIKYIAGFNRFNSDKLEHINCESVVGFFSRYSLVLATIILISAFISFAGYWKVAVLIDTVALASTLPISIYTDKAKRFYK